MCHHYSWVSVGTLPEKPNDATKVALHLGDPFPACLHVLLKNLPKVEAIDSLKY
jgi:hypothetical protein